MALHAGPWTESRTEHDDDHAELYELLADMDQLRNAAALGGIQAAHDALPAGGGTIWLPPGYAETPADTIDITKPCVIQMGAGAKISHGGTTGYFDLIHVSSAVDGFALIGRGIIDGRFGTGRTGGGGQLLLNGCSRAWVEGVRFINSPDLFVIVEGATDTWISRCRFFNSAGGGVKYGGQNRAGSLDDCRFDTFQNSCVFFDQPGVGVSQQAMTVSGCKFRNTQRSGDAGRAAIQTFGDGPASEEWFRRFKILDNDVFNSTQPTGGTQDLVGIGLDQLTDGLVRGNHVVNVLGGGSEGIICNGSRNKLCGNHVQYASAGGIGLLSYGNGCQVADCVVCCNIVEGNNDTTGQGINFVACDPAGNAVTGLLITGNRCFKNGYGIQSYNNGGTLAGSNNLVVANQLTGNLSGAASFVAGSGQLTTSVNHPAI
jgi:hypothetical protein